MTDSFSKPRLVWAIALSLIISFGLSLPTWHTEIPIVQLPDTETEDNTSPTSIPWQAYSCLAVGLLLTTLWGLFSRKLQVENQGLREQIQQIQQEQRDFSNQLHQLQQKLEQAQAESQIATKAKQEFLCQLNEQLCSPLHIIIGYIQLLQQDKSLAKVNQSYLALLRSNSHNLWYLLQDILEIAQIQAGQPQVQPVSFNLYHCLESLQVRFESQAIAKGLTLIFYVPQDIPPVIITDERKLTQILSHLLDNGIRYTDSGGVTLRLGIGDRLWSLEKEDYSNSESSECYLFIEIEDTGSGMDTEKLEEVFVPFSRLGLAHSKQLIELMGGQINVSSQVNQGTLVKLKLPINLPKLVDSRQFSRVIGLAANQPEYRILVADDKQENRQLLVKLLEPLGFNCQEAENGQEVLEISRQWYPHLIWIDPKMLILDGDITTAKIKQLPKDTLSSDTEIAETVIIALSAGILEENQVHLLAAGCDDVVYKPIEVEVLLEKMAEHLGVSYIYQEKEENFSFSEQETSKLFLNNWYYSPSEKPTFSSLEAEELTSISPKWIASLHQAANAGDSGKIYQLIKQIASNHPLFARYLQQLIHQFNFREIRELTQKNLTQKLTNKNH